MDRRLCTAVIQSVADLVDDADDACGVTGPPGDDFVVHLESGDLADGAEHLEDAEAFPPPDVVRGARCAGLEALCRRWMGVGTITCALRLDI